MLFGAHRPAERGSAYSEADELSDDEVFDTKGIYRRAGFASFRQPAREERERKRVREREKEQKERERSRTGESRQPAAP